MNRRLLVPFAAPLLAASLASCTVDGGLIEQFGPRPNETVLELADLAQADARAAAGTAGTQGDTPAQRQHHADDLYGEVARLCGTNAAGELPNSCQFDTDPGETPAHPDAAAALNSYLAAVDRVPEQSRDMVVSQAVDIVAAAAAEGLPEIPVSAGVDGGVSGEELDNATADRLRGLLAAEHAAVWALDAVQAYLDDAATERISAAIEAHERRIAALKDVLEPTGAVPAAEPGYQFEHASAPADLTQAYALANRILTDTALAWTNAAAEVDDDGARAWLISLAGHAAAADRAYSL